jgi:hypothetical protein
MESGCSNSAAGATVWIPGEKRVGPSLKGLFHKHELANGIPANERSIRRKIMIGGDGMPGYERIFSSKEVGDLIAYLKSR